MFPRDRSLAGTPCHRTGASAIMRLPKGQWQSQSRTLYIIQSFCTVRKS